MTEEHFGPSTRRSVVAPSKSPGGKGKSELSDWHTCTENDEAGSACSFFEKRHIASMSRSCCCFLRHDLGYEYTVYFANESRRPQCKQLGCGKPYILGYVYRWLSRSPPHTYIASFESLCSSCPPSSLSLLLKFTSLSPLPQDLHWVSNTNQKGLLLYKFLLLTRSLSIFSDNFF